MNRYFSSSLYKLEELYVVKFSTYHEITFDSMIFLLHKIYSLQVFAFDFQHFIGPLHFHSREEEVLLRVNMQVMTVITWEFFLVRFNCEFLCNYNDTICNVLRFVGIDIVSTIVNSYKWCSGKLMSRPLYKTFQHGLSQYLS